MLFVRDVHNRPGPENFEAAAQEYWPEQPFRVPRVTLADWVEQVRIPAVQISPALASTLVRSTGSSLEALSRAAESSGGTQPVPVPAHEVELITTVNRHVIPDRNVVGWVEGSDPRLKEETVIVCAHYDHNGAEGDRIYNGADDDGSGTIGVIERQSVRPGSAGRPAAPAFHFGPEFRGTRAAGRLGLYRALRSLNKTYGLNRDMIDATKARWAFGFRGLTPNGGIEPERGQYHQPRAASTGRGGTAPQHRMDLRLRYDNNI